MPPLDLPLPTDNAWQSDAIRRACALFPNMGTREIAETMVLAHPYVIQYLEQAPAVVPFVTMGAIARTRNDRMMVATRIGSAVHRGPRLKEFLREFRAVLPLRKLRGSAVLPSNFATIIDLRTVPPSALSQAIPEKPLQQREWLRALRIFRARYTHNLPMRDTAAEWLWAVTAFSVAVRADVPKVYSRVTDITDMLVHTRGRFNPAWTFQSALADAARWHEELAKRANEANFLKRHGVEFEHQIDYAPLLNEQTVEGFAFVALRSGLDLFMDGKEMHHCVSSYSRDVILGPTRIYSIKRDGLRVATMELRPLAKIYEMVQLKGPYNQEPPKTVKAAARLFVDQQNQAINLARGKKR